MRSICVLYNAIKNLHLFPDKVLQRAGVKAYAVGGPRRGRAVVEGLRQGRRQRRHSPQRAVVENQALCDARHCLSCAELAGEGSMR